MAEKQFRMFLRSPSRPWALHKSVLQTGALDPVIQAWRLAWFVSKTSSPPSKPCSTASTTGQCHRTRCRRGQRQARQPARHMGDDCHGRRRPACTRRPPLRRPQTRPSLRKPRCLRVGFTPPLPPRSVRKRYGRRARGALNGSMACTTGEVNRPIDRLSCIAWRRTPRRRVLITERA